MAVVRDTETSGDGREVGGIGIKEEMCQFDLIQFQRKYICSRKKT